MASIINASSSGSGGIVQTADASGVLQLQNNGTTAVTVTGGSVGIGIESPTAQLEISRSATNAYSTMRLSNTGASGRTYEIGVGGNTTASGFANNLYFYDSTAGAVRMAITSNGYVTTPSQPAFYAVGTAVGAVSSGTYQAGIGGGSPAVFLNNGSNYNSSTGVFTAPVAGMYFFSITATCANVPPNLGIGLTKNGTSQSAGYQLCYNTAYNGNSFSAIISMAVGDTMKGEMFWNNSVSGNTYSSTFSGFLMG